MPEYHTAKIAENAHNSHSAAIEDEKNEREQNARCREERKIFERGDDR